MTGVCSEGGKSFIDCSFLIVMVSPHFKPAMFIPRTYAGFFYCFSIYSFVYIDFSKYTLLYIVKTLDAINSSLDHSISPQACIGE